MKKFRYNAYKLYQIIYIALAIAAYFKNENLLSFLSSMAMYFIVIESIYQARRLKLKFQIKSIADNKGYYKSINTWFIYIIALALFSLALAQNMNLFHFNKINNLVFSLSMAVYLLYINEKHHKANSNYEKYKQESIDKIGKEEFERREREHEEFFKKLEEDFSSTFDKKEK